MPEFCVTGGSGFIASYIVKALLENGHTVRSTVRNPDDVEKVGFLWELRGAKERLKILRADLEEEGSFDEAIEGVDGVFHTAAPVVISYDDDDVEKSLIEPTVKGAVNVLRSCARAKVRRVVMTSSCSAIRYRDDAHQLSPLNESHWTDLQYCKRYNLWYAYAKTVAEREAWKVAEESGLDLVAVHPSYVVGPLLAPKPTSTLLLLLAIIKGCRREYPNQQIGFVHIHDVVSAHLIAMLDPKASGRLVCSGAVAHWSHVIHFLRASYPSYPYEPRCSNQEGDDIPHSMDTSKIAALGLPTFRSLQDMFHDCINSFQQKGLL